MDIVNLHMCSNNTVLVFIIRMVSIIWRCIQTPIAKGVQDNRGSTVLVKNGLSVVCNIHECKI